MWERLFERILGSIVKDGTLELTLPSGRLMVTGEGAPHVKARITSESRIAAVVRDPDLGTAEGYMDGEILLDGDKPEDEALCDFLGLALDNMRKGHRHWSQDAAVRIGKHARRLSQFNPAPQARKNAAHHYDLSAKLYDIFLDEDRQYSCAYWQTDDITLEEAQLAKKRHIAKKLLIEPGMRILDIGCGWGGMAITLAEEFGAEVVGVTLSEEQHKLATERVRAKGLEGKIDIRLQDYRDVEGPFDRIVSVGMFEHVGQPHYDEYFRRCRALLKEDGVALIHTIGRTNPPGITSAFIRKYVFPGGYIPALSETSAAIERQGLVTSDLEVWRLHYAKTLRVWADRFEAGADEARALFDDRFVRMWRYYLVASEMSFVHGQQVVFQFQLTRTNNAVPITRDYLYS